MHGSPGKPKEFLDRRFGFATAVAAIPAIPAPTVFVFGRRALSEHEALNLVVADSSRRLPRAMLVAAAITSQSGAQDDTCGTRTHAGRPSA